MLFIYFHDKINNNHEGKTNDEIILRCIYKRSNKVWLNFIFEHFFLNDFSYIWSTQRDPLKWNPIMS